MEMHEIAAEIREWSWANFGPNKSKIPPYIELNSLAALMGIGEEIGELLNALQTDDKLDAIGDIMIYMLDYMGREDINVKSFFAFQKNAVAYYEQLPIPYGRLLHATLKTHQGIRGYDDPKKYYDERNHALVYLVSSLRLELKIIDTQKTLEELTTEVWQKIVSKRNWKKDATS